MNNIDLIKEIWRGCPECKSKCGLCKHCGAWDRYGKPSVCAECVDCSNFESDQDFCEYCGSPMTSNAMSIMVARVQWVQRMR